MSKPAPTFVIFYTPGPQWQAGTPLLKQPAIPEHFAYMENYHRSGQTGIVMGGPFGDDSGAMLVTRVATLAEARAIAEADPLVQAGTVEATIRPWRVAIST